MKRLYANLCARTENTSSSTSYALPGKAPSLACFFTCKIPLITVLSGFMSKYFIHTKYLEHYLVCRKHYRRWFCYLLLPVLWRAFKSNTNCLLCTLTRHKYMIWAYSFVFLVHHRQNGELKKVTSTTNHGFQERQGTFRKIHGDVLIWQIYKQPKGPAKSLIG